MANQLTSLTKFTENLFRYAYMLFPWFAMNFTERKYKVSQYDKVIEILEVLKKDRHLFFGDNGEFEEANAELSLFYDTLEPGGKGQANADAMDHYRQAWKLAYSKRAVLQLRGHESKMMTYFHEVLSGGEHIHLAELQSMARVVGKDVIRIARLVTLPGGWTPKEALTESAANLEKLKTKVFGDGDGTPENIIDARKKDIEEYQRYQQALRDYKHIASLRIIEIFDAKDWDTVIDSATLHKTLVKEGLGEFLPATFRGRVGVQPSGYPLTFYTYSGLELEAPPLNEVVMNPNYGLAEKDKDYKTHPVSDGAYYCEMKAVAGETWTKLYTLEYKRRARKQKYESVAKLGKQIEGVRTRMLKHLKSSDRGTWVRALMCLFIDHTCARIGNTASTKNAKKTYGVTTLLTKKHAKVHDDRVVISYRGKHDQPQKHTLLRYRTRDTVKKKPVEYAIAEKLAILIEEKNEHIFTHENGKPFTPQSVNEYFRATKADPENGLPEGGAGSSCTVHTLRNYHATEMFRKFADYYAAKQKRAPAYPDVVAAYQGRSKTKTRSGIKGIIEKIAKMLGNTPAICRKSYIEPRDQLLFFKRWDYRPPDGLIHDLFVDEAFDTYGLDGKPTSRKRFKFDDDRGQISQMRQKVTK